MVNDNCVILAKKKVLMSVKPECPMSSLYHLEPDIEADTDMLASSLLVPPLKSTSQVSFCASVHVCAYARSQSRTFKW